MSQAVDKAQSFKVSVIVPIYNVEEYLAECLDSLLHQTIDSIEVVMVDDGSPDNSAVIAKKYAEKYPNFVYYYKENGGLGSARNFGVKQARGEYITFVDSDDIVDDDLYEKMYYRANKDNSDMAICNVLRFNSKMTIPSGLHQYVFKNIENNTHITKNPNLFFDTISCNKLFRRSFFIENGLEFPTGILYEDIPVMIPAHFLANNVSVVETSYYWWRMRDGASKSITQNTGSLKNLNDRLSVLERLEKFYKEHNVPEDIVIQSEKKNLIIDLMIFVNACKSVTSEQAYAIFDVINAFIKEHINPKAFDLIPIIFREKYKAVMANDLKRLLDIYEYQLQGYYSAELKENDDRLIMTAPTPLFDKDRYDVTEEIKQFTPKQSVKSVKVENDGIEIVTGVFIPRINIPSAADQNVEAYLQNELTGALIKLDVTPTVIEETTTKFGSTFDPNTEITTKYDYTGTGYKISLKFNSLSVKSENEGNNRILIYVKNRIINSHFLLTASNLIGDGDGTVSGNLFASVEHNPLKGVRIYLKNCDNFAAHLEQKGSIITVKLENDAKALLAVDEKGNKIAFDKKEHALFTCPCSRFSEKEIYFLSYENAKGSQALYYPKRSVIVSNGEDSSCVFMTNKNHRVRFILDSSLTVIKKIAKNGAMISFTTSTKSRSALGADSAVLYVPNEIAGGKTVFATAECNGTKDAVCKFDINFGNEDVIENLYASTRDVFVDYIKGGKIISTTKIYSNTYCRLVVEYETLQLSLYRSVDASIMFKSRLLWRDEENTVAKRKSLAAELYPKFREEPLNEKQIIFESMWGSKYSCNPQHLYEYIDKNYPQYQCIWVLRDEFTPIKGNAVKVRRGSIEYFHYLATAKYLVNNVNFEDAYVKRDGQIEIQTMHGTPLKTLGLDVTADFASDNAIEKYVAKNSRWNYLLVQGKFMEGKAYDCYRFTKEILKFGYPRTDELFNVDRNKVEAIKRELGLPLDKKVILYTPTWRKMGAFDMEMDIEKMREALSDEYILLVRLHHLCAPGDAVEVDNKFAFDLHSYRCVEDLYLISDILITDYSSVMFDYALLNKPMLFFTYDLEDYRDNLRGLYVDIEKEVPGPLVFNTDEIIDCVNNIDSVLTDNKERIETFKQKYLTYEVGNSCEQIVNYVMKPTDNDRKPAPKRKAVTVKLKANQTSYKKPSLLRRIARKLLK